MTKRSFIVRWSVGTILCRKALLCVVALASCLAACVDTEAPPAAQMLAAAQAMNTAKTDSVKAYEDLLRTAIQKAEVEADWKTCANASLLLAAQLQWTDEKEALQLAQKAQRLVKDHSVDAAKLVPQINLTLAGLYEQMGEYEHARALYNSCVNDSASHRTALGHLANISLAEGDAVGALALARRMMTTGGGADDLESQFILANCYLQNDSLQQARRIYEALAGRSDSKMQYAVRRHLTEIAIAEERLGELPVMLDSAFESAEAVFFEALQQKDVYFRATLEQEKQAEHLAYKQKMATWVLIALSLVAILVVAFLVMMIRHRRAIHLQRLQTEQRERQLMAERLEQQGEKIQLLQHFILEKNELLQRLREEGDHKKQLSQREWLDVEQLLDNITGGFVTRLRAQHPDFQEEDIQLCMLTRMKLSNQVIASIYLITVSAVKHRKLKLKKAGFGENNPDRPLDEVLLDI